MDAKNIMSEANDRFEDVAGARFHEDVRATIIFEQLLKEHGRAKVLRAFDGFLEESPNPFEGEALAANARPILSVIRNELGDETSGRSEALLPKHPCASFAPTKGWECYDRL